MAATKVEIRRGTYYDSIVLMQLQSALTALPGVSNAAVVMGTAANKELLKQSDLPNEQAQSAQADDLVIVVTGQDAAAVTGALQQVDSLLARRRQVVEQDYRPKSLAAARKFLPEAEWVQISVPGRYAAGVAREALHLQKNVFLYSDNVSLEDEIALKKQAADQGLLVMGPDCGTAIINGVGLGFANRVRRGAIGLIGASGTGLQQVSARIHQLGGGVTHALGTGGRDLSKEVNAITFRQCLQLLQRDPETKVLVLVSKPPDKRVAAQLLQLARRGGKPVVVNFIGMAAGMEPANDSLLHFTSTLDEAAELAVKLAKSAKSQKTQKSAPEAPFAAGQRFVRGLFSGGTLAYETLLILQNYLPEIYSNIALDPKYRLQNPQQSQGHTVLDLGEDEFTMGRPHPMLDHTLRLQRLQQEAADPEVAVIILDVVLGYGAHPDPASQLAPAIAKAKSQAKKQGRHLECVAVVVGTDEDPQDLAAQMAQLTRAGARVETNHAAAAAHVGQLVQPLQKLQSLPPVLLTCLTKPLQVINVGVESFAASLKDQEAAVVHVDWRPPAGGNEKLMSILERMKQK
ncbi:MAG: acyl-CoA synthetase FdrA [bacterium]